MQKTLSLKANHSATYVRRASVSDHEMETKARGSLLFMPRKRKELVAVQKSSHFLSLFSRESNSGYLRLSGAS